MCHHGLNLIPVVMNEVGHHLDHIVHLDLRLEHHQRGMGEHRRREVGQYGVERTDRVIRLERVALVHRSIEPSICSNRSRIRDHEVFALRRRVDRDIVAHRQPVDDRVVCIGHTDGRPEIGDVLLKRLDVSVITRRERARWRDV